VQELKKRSYLISGRAKVFRIILQKIQCSSAIITYINYLIHAFASQFFPSTQKMKWKGYMVYVQNWESIRYTKHGLLTLMFMKNKCSKFPDSKQPGMPDRKQHVVLANLPSHFFPHAVLLSCKMYTLQSFPRLIVSHLPFHAITYVTDSNIPHIGTFSLNGSYSNKECSVPSQKNALPSYYSQNGSK
jgi:hypothetical protein